MSEIGSGSSPLSPSKLCVEHNVRESEMKATKRRKITCSTSGHDDIAPAGARVVQEQNTSPAQPTNTELHDQDHTPSIEVAENVEVVSHESASQVGGNQNWDLSSNHVRVGSGSSQTADTLLLPHQSAASQLSSLPCVPLQHASENNTKEIEQLRKRRKDLVLELKSNRERETRELLAQIEHKYNSKYQKAEAEYRYKMNELENNRRKITMNRLLAESFSWRGIQQDGVSNSNDIKHPTMGHQPVLGYPITSANIQALQFNGGASQSLRAPLVINTITPTTNPRVGGYVRSGAPHLRPSAVDHRPNISANSAAASSSSQSHVASSDYICISDDDI